MNPWFDSRSDSDLGIRPMAGNEDASIIGGCKHYPGTGQSCKGLFNQGYYDTGLDWRVFRQWISIVQVKMSRSKNLF